MTQLTLQQAFDLASQHQSAGRLHEAQILCRQILVQQPAHLGAIRLLGAIAHHEGRTDLAADLMRQAIALDPASPETHFNLGNVLRDMGQLDEAIAAYRQAIALHPNFPEAHGNLGNALKGKGRIDDAIAAYRRAIALRPNFPEAHNNLGNSLTGKGQLDEAIAAYRQAIALNPNFPEFHGNLGNALKEKGQLDEAAAACQRAIALRPGYAKAHNNLGNVLRIKGQLDEAIAAYRQAIALSPNLPSVRVNLGNALLDLGQLDGAIAAYRQAIVLSPNSPEAPSDLIYTLYFHPGYDAEAIAEEHRRWNRQHAEPLRTSIQIHSNDRRPDRRLRLGYVSADFCNTACAYFLDPLLKHHDPRQVELFCYAHVLRPDARTLQFQRYAAAWRNIAGISDEQVAGQIREDRIDILVDLKLHAPENRLLVFARKPAPVQVTWLGYPGSTGLTTIDYRLSDPFLDPPAVSPAEPPGMDESVYSEHTIRLPDTFWCYDPLTTEPAVNALPAPQRGHITFGCLNNFCKVNDGVLALWAKVLRQVENSRLLLLAPLGDPQAHALDRFRQEGIDPARIEFVPRQPREKYLETYHRIDLGLDTFPYNGHTTSLDSFWMGVPVVTLVGNRAVARAGLCLLSNLGLAELASRTPERFVHIAAELARDLPRLAQLRSTLRRRMEQSPLMDAPRFARNIEDAYRKMWHSWCENQPM
jgi:protein O-GlcNAc transferase